MKAHLQNADVINSYHAIVEKSPEKSIDQLQRDIRSTLGLNASTFNTLDWKFFLHHHGPMWCLLSPNSGTHTATHTAIKIPDLLASTFHGDFPNKLTYEDLSILLASNLLLCHQTHAVALQWGLHLSPDHLLRFLGSFIMNFSVYTNCIAWYVKGLNSMSRDVAFQVKLMPKRLLRIYLQSFESTLLINKEPRSLANRQYDTTAQNRVS
jgi:hypothetical protein